MQKRKLIIVAGLIIMVFGWYLFRPERIFINKTVNEEFPVEASQKAGSKEVSPATLFAGRFHGVAHDTKGVATVFQLPDGKRVLRLSEFETSNGPDVQVYLVAAPDAEDSETVTKAGFIHIGALKGNIGDQNYDLPPNVDFSKHRAVTVWCRRFGVNFGTAPLKPQPKEEALAAN